MPPEGDRVKDETIWDMVNYVRSFAKKAAPEKSAEEKTSNSPANALPEICGSRS